MGRGLGCRPWPPAPYPVGGDRLWLFDHDGDGLLDVIVGSGSHLSLLRGAGLPGLGAAEPLGELEGHLRAGGVGSYAGQRGLLFLTDRGLWFLGEGERTVAQVLDRGGQALAVGDFTGDGTLDVAMGEYLSVWVYPGMSEGLGEPAELRVDQPVAWLLSGDFNGDGLADLVAGSSSPAGVSVFYGHPERGFLGPYEHGVEVPALRGLPAMADLAVVADFTGDGRDDLAIAASLGHIALFSTQPRGRSLQAIPGSFLLGAADVNADGYPDLLTSMPAGGVAVLVNSGWGTFTAQELVGPSGDFRASRMPYLARLGDVTGDGVNELVVWEFAREFRSEARITVWTLGGKLLWSQPLGAGVRPVLVLADQTGDGVRDVVTGVGTTVVVLTAGADGLPQRREVPWGGPVGPLVGLRDGTVAGLRLAPGVALVLLRGGEPVETGLTLELAPLDLIACDFDGDGREDLITIGWTAWEGELAMALGVFWGEEDGFRPELYPLEGWPALALPYPYGGLGAADLDGDGRVELAAMRLPDREGNPGGVVVIPWTEGGPEELLFLPGCVGTNLLALDLDGDGRAELLSVQTGIPARLCLARWEVER